jgi:hypothetical protein
LKPRFGWRTTASEATRHHPAQEVLRLPPAQPEPRRHPAGELDDGAIEERDACLERVRHRHPVGLREQIGREIEHRVDVLQAIEVVPARLGPEPLVEAHGRGARHAVAVRVQRGLHVLAENRHPPEVAGGRREVRPGDELLRLVIEARAAV